VGTAEAATLGGWGVRIVDVLKPSWRMTAAKEIV